MEPADADRVKLGLASDLRWLIHEGYLIEFNDGTLDLPRPKAPPAAGAAPAAAAIESTTVDPPAAESVSVPDAITPSAALPVTEAAAAEEMVDGLNAGPEGAGGIQVEQTTESQEESPPAAADL